MEVQDVMTPNPACCTPDDPAQRAALLMRNLDVGAIPILNNEQQRRPIGLRQDLDAVPAVQLQRGQPARGVDRSELETRDDGVAHLGGRGGLAALRRQARHQQWQTGQRSQSSSRSSWTSTVAARGLCAMPFSNGAASSRLPTRPHGRARRPRTPPSSSPRSA